MKEIFLCILLVALSVFFWEQVGYNWRSWQGAFVGVAVFYLIACIVRYFKRAFK